MIIISSHYCIILTVCSFTCVDWQVNVITQQSLGFLNDNQFVLHSSDGSLRPSQLGLATALSGISPVDALTVLPSLQQACRRFVLKTGFHAVFLATPPNASISPVWSDYETILNAMYTDYPVSLHTYA